MERKFKVGDKCYIELTVKNIIEHKNVSYPVETETSNGDEFSFTKDGSYSIHDNTSILKHIHEGVFWDNPENIRESQYPKWMMVSDYPITKKDKGCKRFVIYGDETGFTAIIDGYNECNGGSRYWKYAKDIEENNELEELKKTYTELGEKIKQLEEK